MGREATKPGGTRPSALVAVLLALRAHSCRVCMGPLWPGVVGMGSPPGATPRRTNELATWERFYPLTPRVTTPSMSHAAAAFHAGPVREAAPREGPRRMPATREDGGGIRETGTAVGGG